MEMEKSYYVVTSKPTYIELVRGQRGGAGPTETDDAISEKIIVAITQGGFGQDVIDDQRQVKERFLEHLFSSSGVDLPRMAEVFDRYFDLEETGEFIDLDEEF